MNKISHLRSTHTITTALLLAAASGCSLDDEVSVGKAGHKLNLDQCYATKSDCDGALDVLGAKSPDPIECTAGSSLVNIEGPLPEVDLCDGDCGVPQAEAEVSPDGSYWLLWKVSSVSGTEEVTRLFVEHVAADGTLLGLARIELDAWLIDCKLVVDEEGGAEVATYTQYAPDADSNIDETTTLYAYLPDVTLRNAPIALVGVASPHLAVDSSGDYVVAGNAYSLAKRGVIGRIQRDGTLVLTNNQIPTRGSKGRGIVAFAARQEVGYGLLAEAPDSSDAEPMFQVLRYDQAFEPQWSVALPSPAAPGYGASMVSDPDGRLVAAVVLGDPLLPLPPR